MTTNTLKTRIKHRIDTAANWANTTDIPLLGELIIYAGEGDIPTKMKIGDGVRTASNLPFITDVDMNGLSAGVRIPESDTNDLGSETQGVYWKNGRPQLMKYELSPIGDAEIDEICSGLIEESLAPTDIDDLMNELHQEE